MREASKAMTRRLHDVRYASRYFVGNGIDIGAGNDSIGLYAEWFPGMRQVRAWDLPDGDAQLLQSVADESLDFVHSSHCLEHMRDPVEALRHWFRVLKPGGHLVCVVPDEDLYEQGVFPSTFNSDHKWTFSLWKAASWSAAPTIGRPRASSVARIHGTCAVSAAGTSSTSPYATRWAL